MVSYADNFLLMAEDESELTRLTTILADACHTHPSGRLLVKTAPTVHNEPFDFLGYKFTPRMRRLPGVKWTDKHEAKARSKRRRAHKVLHSKAPINIKHGVYNECELRHRQKLAGFPAWGGGKGYVDGKLAPLKALVPPLGHKTDSSPGIPID